MTTKQRLNQVQHDLEALRSVEQSIDDLITECQRELETELFSGWNV